MKDFMRNIKNIHIIKIDKKNHKYVKKTFKKNNKTSNNTYNKVFLFSFIFYLPKTSKFNLPSFPFFPILFFPCLQFFSLLIHSMFFCAKQLT